MIWKAATLVDYIIAGSVFVLVLSVWLGFLLLWWNRRLTIKDSYDERLGLAEDGESMRVLRLWHDGREATTSVADRSGLSNLMLRADVWARAMGLGVSGFTLLFCLAAGAVLVALLTYALTQQVLLTIAIPVASGLLLNMYTQHRWQKHIELFEEQFLSALQVATTSLRAGHPLSGAFRFVAVEVDPPVGELFSQVTQEQELGISLEDALRKVSNVSQSPDMKLFATSVLVQVKSGGNLADMMERLGEVIRDRLRRRRRLRVLTAETQFSKRVLLAMPLVVFVGMNLLRPEYMRPLYQSAAGKTAMGFAIVLLLAGAWVMNRMAALEL